MRKLGSAMIGLGVLDLLVAAVGLVLYAVAHGSESASLKQIVIDAQPALANDAIGWELIRRRIIANTILSNGLFLGVELVLAVSGLLAIILGVRVRRSAARLVTATPRDSVQPTPV